MNTHAIISRLYPHLLRRRVRPPWIRLAHRAAAWLRRYAWHLIIGGVLLVGWIAAHVYYYNMLVDMEFNVQAAWAQVETVQQRRAHVQKNLAPLVNQYGQHERNLMELVAKIRTKQLAPKAASAAAPQLEGPPAPPSLGQVAPAPAPAPSPIQLLAEQYPQLRLTENFQQFSTAVIDAEDRIANAIQLYNDAVNAYTTVLEQFPGVIFARLCGFQGYEFYAPTRADVRFHPVS